MSRHIVFGTGQVGRTVVEQLVASGEHVVAVNRSGRDELPGARVVAADAADSAVTTELCTGADVVYFCLNATRYDRWAEEFPPLQLGVLAGASSAGARLVVLDNLYAYGPPRGRRLVETSSDNPTSAKAATRAAMTQELLGAHRGGQVEVVIGRASDYFGPRTTHTALGETVFGAAVRGGTAQVMGDPDQPHSYSYTADVAAALILLGGATTEATGQIWNLPVAPARTTREMITDIYRLAGHQPRVLAAGRTTLRLLGLVKPELREYLHTLYQFTDPWIVDDTKFCAAFGVQATPSAESLATTVTWFRDRDTVPVH